MRILKTYESFIEGEKFEIDLETINRGDNRGFLAISDILKSANISLKDCLEYISTKLVEKEFAFFDTKFQLVGSGQYGIAFGFRDKVFKITTSMKEVETCKSLMGKELKNIVKYHLQLQFLDYPIWFIVMDKLEMLSKKEKDIYTTLYYLGANDINNPNFRFNSKSELFDELQVRLANPEPEDELPPYHIENDELRVYFKKYFKLVRSLDEQGITTDDLHGENIGLRNDRLVHFDIMEI